MVSEWTGLPGEGKCKSALSGPTDWILRYIKTYLYFVLPFCFWYYQDLQEKYDLKGKVTVLSRNVWDILMLLPTNPHIATQFHDLKSNVSRRSKREVTWTIYVCHETTISVRICSVMFGTLLDVMWGPTWCYVGPYLMLCGALLDVMWGPTWCYVGPYLMLCGALLDVMWDSTWCYVRPYLMLCGALLDVMWGPTWCYVGPYLMLCGALLDVMWGPTWCYVGLYSVMFFFVKGTNILWF